MAAGCVPAPSKAPVPSEKVVVRPGGPYKPVEIDIYGRIQALFPTQEQETGAPMGVLVAGARNHREFPIRVTV
jgi:hypothetical protein